MAAMIVAAATMKLPQANPQSKIPSLPMVRRVNYGSIRKFSPIVANVGIDPTAAMEGDFQSNSNHWDGTTEVAQAEWSESQQQENTSTNTVQESRNTVEEEPWARPQYKRPAYYDNDGRLLNFIVTGRAMQLALKDQKEFDMFLEKCGAFGVMLPEDSSDIKSKLHELDPKQTWIVVDSRAVMKFAKKLALEEAEKKGNDYPPGFVEDMLNRDKYGRYDSDDDI